MKTYVITLAKTFPKGHPKAGEKTPFHGMFLYSIGCPHCEFSPKRNLNIKRGFFTCDSCLGTILSFKFRISKIHTIRTNVSLWSKRMKEVEAGKDRLSIREWAGRPYLSKQVEIVRLTREDGVGMQRLDGNDVWAKEEVCKVYDKHGVKPVRAEELAMKDGLSLDDWRAWFGRNDADSDLAIIHFTPFRY